MWIKNLFLLILCCSFISCSQQNEPIFKDSHNQTLQLSTLRGKWIIINYWAPWCPSCIHEIPELNHFYKNNTDKNIMLLGVNFDTTNATDFKTSIKKAKIEFPVILEDPGVAWKLDNINAIPTTFIIDPTGKVAKVLMGPTTEKDLTETLNQLQKK